MITVSQPLATIRHECEAEDGFLIELRLGNFLPQRWHELQEALNAYREQIHDTDQMHRLVANCLYALDLEFHAALHTHRNRIHYADVVQAQHTLQQIITALVTPADNLAFADESKPEYIIRRACTETSGVLADLRRGHFDYSQLLPLLQALQACQVAVAASDTLRRAFVGDLYRLDWALREAVSTLRGHPQYDQLVAIQLACSEYIVALFMPDIDLPSSLVTQM